MSSRTALRVPAGRGGTVKRGLQCYRAGGRRFPERQALPRMRFIVVPQTGQGPFAILIPVLETTTVPWKSRFSLHFTQYPL
jgi:hypothetical protein